MKQTAARKHPAGELPNRLPLPDGISAERMIALYRTMVLLRKFELAAQIVSAIEEHHGMVGGMTRNAFTPGLMTGLAGVIHTLVRMHVDCSLPSPLLLERRGRAA